MNEVTANERRLAIAAEALYLVNLLLLPVVAFVVLWWLQRRCRRSGPLARCHLSNAVCASWWALALLVGASAGFLFIGGIDSLYAWTFVLIYAVTVHTAFVLLGVVGLARALAGQPLRFVLLEMACDR